jgi:hypothetical protein
MTRRPARLRTCGALAAALACAPAVARAQGDSATARAAADTAASRARVDGGASPRGAVVSGMLGAVNFGFGSVTLVGLDIADVEPGHLGGHAALSTYLEAIRNGAILMDFEGGPSFPLRLGSAAVLMPYGGLNLLVSIVGSRVYTGYGGDLGAAVMAALSPRTWVRLSLSHRWYAGSADVTKATAVAIGVGVRTR